jgi:peptidoglycan-N-acetylglucosamine deacetylase
MSPRFVICFALLFSFPAFAQESQPTIALTFDDLPAHGPLAPGQHRRDVVNSILATLKAQNMPPSYGFVNAFRLDHHPYQIEILQAWHNAGQSLGNHTYSHEELSERSVAWYTRDIAANEALLQKVDPTGDWHWFRYPYLEEGDTPEKRTAVRDWLQQHGYKIAEVSMSFEDYRWNDAYGRCNDRHDRRSIALLHDTYLAAADEYITRYRSLTKTLYGRDIPYVLLLHVGSFDAKMLPELIALFRSRGFQFVSLPVAESDPVYASDPGGVLKNGGSMQELLAQSRGVQVPEDNATFQQVDDMCQPSATARSH